MTRAARAFEHVLCECEYERKRETGVAPSAADTRHNKMSQNYPAFVKSPFPTRVPKQRVSPEPIAAQAQLSQIDQPWLLPCSSAVARGLTQTAAPREADITNVLGMSMEAPETKGPKANPYWAPQRFIDFELNRLEAKKPAVPAIPTPPSAARASPDLAEAAAGTTADTGSADKASRYGGETGRRSATPASAASSGPRIPLISPPASASSLSGESYYTAAPGSVDGPATRTPSVRLATSRPTCSGGSAAAASTSRPAAAEPPSADPASAACEAAPEPSTESSRRDAAATMTAEPPGAAGTDGPSTDAFVPSPSPAPIRKIWGLT